VGVSRARTVSVTRAASNTAGESKTTVDGRGEIGLNNQLWGDKKSDGNIAYLEALEVRSSPVYRTGKRVAVWRVLKRAEIQLFCGEKARGDSKMAIRKRKGSAVTQGRRPTTWPREVGLKRTG